MTTHSPNNGDDHDHEFTWIDALKFWPVLLTVVGLIAFAVRLEINGDRTSSAVARLEGVIEAHSAASEVHQTVAAKKLLVKEEMKEMAGKLTEILVGQRVLQAHMEDVGDDIKKMETELADLKKKLIP